MYFYYCYYLIEVFVFFYIKKLLGSRATPSVNAVLDILSPPSDQRDAVARDALDVDRSSVDFDAPLPVRKRLQHVVDEAERVIRFAAIGASNVGTVGLDNAGCRKKRNCANCCLNAVDV